MKPEFCHVLRGGDGLPKNESPTERQETSLGMEANGKIVGSGAGRSPRPPERISNVCRKAKYFIFTDSDISRTDVQTKLVLTSELVEEAVNITTAIVVDSL